MDSPRRPKRRSVVLACSFFAVVLLFSCNTCQPQASLGQIALCAVDPAYVHNAARVANPEQEYCGPGDFQAVHGTQLVTAVAFDSSGHQVQSPQLTFKVSGANGHASIVTGSGGFAQFSYAGDHAGDDSITASFSDGTAVAPMRPAVVRWLNAGQYIRPIVFVHGIDEDASDYVAQLDTSFVDSESNTRFPEGNDKGEQVFSTLIGALQLKYDPTYLEAFCYVDDQAYVNAPQGCRTPDPAQCSTQSDCVSQSSVDVNAVELAKTVSILSAQAQAAIGGGHAGTAKVTIIAYSMGAAITRALLSGCAYAQSLSISGAASCGPATSLVDNVVFIDGAQQGAWILEANKGLSAASLVGLGIPSGADSPFPPILPTIQQAIYAKFAQVSGGVDATRPAAADLTPGSYSVLGHNAAPIPNSIAVYNFYGDVQLKLGVTVAIWALPGRKTINLGDLLMLAQDDPAQLAPTWGGAGLCEGCASAGPILTSSPAVAPFRTGGTLGGGGPQYYAWVLMDPHALDINALQPLLTVADARSAFSAVTNSPVWHLNTTQPVTMAPGSAIQVQDATGHTDHTDIPTEILYVLAGKDGLSIP